MNKSVLLIAGGAVIGLVLLAIWDQYRQHDGFSGWTFAGNNVGTGGMTLTVAKAYPRVNFERTLNPGDNNQEVEVLQRFINAYNNNQALAVSGTFDDATEQALRVIAGKSSTNIMEFRYNYLNVKAQTDSVANEILTGKRP